MIVNTEISVNIRVATNLLNFLSEIGGIFGLIVSFGSIIHGVIASVSTKIQYVL